MKSTKELAKELGLMKRKRRPEKPHGIGETEGVSQLFTYLFVLDFESTCWQNEKFRTQEIIEFPAVLLNTRTGDIEAEFHTYVQPQETPTLSDFCMELTGIKQDQVDEGIPLFICLKKFTAWMTQLSKTKNFTFLPTISQSTACFLTWSDWDLSVCLHYECKRKQLRRPTQMDYWIDLRATYRKFYNRRPHGLKGALQEVGILFEGREHSGLIDSRNTAMLVRKMIQDGCRLQVTKSIIPTANITTLNTDLWKCRLHAPSLNKEIDPESSDPHASSSSSMMLLPSSSHLIASSSSSLQENEGRKDETVPPEPQLQTCSPKHEHEKVPPLPLNHHTLTLKEQNNSSDSSTEFFSSAVIKSASEKDKPTSEPNYDDDWFDDDISNNDILLCNSFVESPPIKKLKFDAVSPLNIQNRTVTTSSLKPLDKMIVQSNPPSKPAKFQNSNNFRPVCQKILIKPSFSSKAASSKSSPKARTKVSDSSTFLSTSVLLTPINHVTSGNNFQPIAQKNLTTSTYRNEVAQDDKENLKFSPFRNVTNQKSGNSFSTNQSIILSGQSNMGNNTYIRKPLSSSNKILVAPVLSKPKSHVLTASSASPQLQSHSKMINKDSPNTSFSLNKSGVTLVPVINKFKTSSSHPLAMTPNQSASSDSRKDQSPLVTPTMNPVSRSQSFFTPSSSSTAPKTMSRTPPLCNCGCRTKRKAVQNGGPNHGKTFFSCSKKLGCKFFQWEFKEQFAANNSFNGNQSVYSESSFITSSYINDR